MYSLSGYSIILARAAEEALKRLDKRTQDSVVAAIDRLQEEPDRSGDQLVGPLSEYRSYRAAGQRYRIIYKVDQDAATVWVVLVGIRKEGGKRDVYSLAQRLVRLGLLGE